MERGRFAGIVLSTALLAGCGGAGGGGIAGAGARVLPPPSSTPPPSGGPVTYLQNSGGLSSSGTILAGTHQALIAVMSGDSAPAAFTQDTLAVSVSGAAQPAFALSQNARVPVAASRVNPVEAFPADDRALLSAVQTLRSASAAPLARQTQSTLPAVLSVGARAAIWVQKGSLSGNRVNVQVPATLVAQTAHANIWIDASLNLSGAQIAQIGVDTENAYSSDTLHFASPDYPSNAPGLQPQYSSCGPGGGSQGTGPAYIAEPADRRIDVMVVNSANLGGLGGYFSSANLMNQSTLNCLNGSSNTYESNQAPFIFVGWFASSGSTYDLQEDLVRSTAHELQHLINFVNHAILAPGAASSSFSGIEDTYVNEGLSMLAQDLAVDAMYASQGVHFDVEDALSRASVFLSAPQNYSLSAFSGTDPASWGGGAPQYNCGGGCYGEAYLFQRYLRDRFGGDAYTHAMETSGLTGGQNLQSATGETAGSLFGDFALAMAANSLGITSGDPRFSLGSLNVAGSYVDQFGAMHQLGGLAALPLQGDALTVDAPVGGFAFVSMGSVPSNGAAVSISDRATAGGFSLEGGLAQK